MRHDIEILRELVAFDSVSHRSNLPVIAWIEDYFARHGITGVRTYDPTHTKANVWMTVGPADVPGYVLSGHTDVVPVEDQVWTSDPFTLTERDGRLYGRGTCDMKGFLAVCMAKLPEMLARPLARPIHFCFSHDEEVGCIGVDYALREIDRLAPARPLAAFIGEPTNMQVIVAHKSKINFRIDVRGHACHSSRAPLGVNAVDYAARMVVKLREIADRLAASGLRDELYDIPHSTVHTGLFSGGVALNVVPDTAAVVFEFRTIPGEDSEALEAEVRDHARQLEIAMRSVAADSSITVTKFNSSPGFDTPVDSEVTRMAKRLAGRNDHAKVAYSTEAGQFAQTAGIPAIVVGPGSIAQAHGADEYIEISELDRCGLFIDRLIAEARA